MTKEWWNNFFNDSFADLLLERNNQEKLDKEASFLINELNLKKNQVVFDQCCGSGSIACALAKQGIAVIGVDQSASYIKRAKKKASSSNLTCDFYESDALKFIPKKTCDAAFNWYTSFGYSKNDSVNLKMLTCAYKCLKPKGKFVLDYNNPTYIFKNFIAKQTLKMPGTDTIQVIKESKIDIFNGMFVSTWTTTLENGNTETISGESRIYFPRDLKNMLEKCAFKNISFKGSLNGEHLTSNSPRCIVTGEK